MTNLSNVITATLLPEGDSISRDNMNVVAIITSQLGHLSASKRFDAYVDIESVAEDFGTDSEAYSHASAFFGTTPNAVNAGGSLVIGYWRAADEVVAATNGTILGEELVTETALSQLQKIEDGSFDIDVDGTTQTLSDLDFRTSISIANVVSILNTGLTGATASESGQSILITSDTTGDASSITAASEASAGTFVGTILGLSDGSGTTIVDGADSETLSAETKLEAITELKSQVNVKGFVFVAKPTAVEAKALAEYAKAQSIISYDVFDAQANLNVDPDNVVWDIVLSSLGNYRCLYRKDGNRKFATSYMARTHTVNFNAQNSAMTMNLKTLPIAAEAFTQGEIDKAAAVGLDVYTTFKGVPKVLCSGANDFVDNIYNLIAYVDAVQTDAFNLLGTTATKIGQNQRGVDALVDAVEKTSQLFVRAGVFSAGEWSSPDSFGDLDTFKRSIRQNGFYWLAGSLATQLQSERTARKSPVLQNAVKNTGAIHKADIIINFNL